MKMLQVVSVKVIVSTKKKNEVFCTKAVSRIQGDPQSIVDIFWNANEELNWNGSTVQTINILEDRGHDQLIYQQHKTTSAATSKNDVTYRRIKTRQPDGSHWVYSVSEMTNPETRANFRRGWVVFGGFLVEPSDNNGFCQVSSVWCWDFNGWIHEKFVLEEKKTSGFKTFQNWSPSNRKQSQSSRKRVRKSCSTNFGTF